MSEAALGANPARAAPALPIAYINLDEDSARRAAIEHAFGAAGMMLRRLPATRWSRLPASAQMQLYSVERNARCYFKPLVDGEKGCYASHIAAWQGLLESADAAWVILEDDVQPRPGLTAVLAAIAALPPAWDMVKLIGRDDEHPAARRPLVSGFELIRYRRVPSLAAAYVLSRSGARKLLGHFVPIARPVDVDMRLWWECRLQVRGVLPAVVGLAASSALSSIGDRPKPPDLAQRWAKFRFKAAYSVLNLWHRTFGQP